MSLLSWLLVILAGLSLATMVVSLTVAGRSAREARVTIFPIVREEETNRARRAHIAASVTGVIAAIMAGTFFLSGQLPLPSAILRQAPGGAVAVTESPVTGAVALVTSSATPLPPTREQATPTGDQAAPAITQPAAGEPMPPTATPTLTPPTPTPTPVPSPTPTPVPPSPTPAGTPVPAPAGARLGPVAFALQVTDRREPISPTTVFSDTVKRVYAVFPYSGMRNGFNWTQVWYFNDVEFNRGEGSWEWGTTDRSYVFTRLVGAGDYRLELYVNDELLSSSEFMVQGKVAVGGPESPETPESP